MTTARQDVIDTLVGQHQQIKLLFAQVESATGEHKQELFTELVATLAVHETVEQQLVHPLAERELPDGPQVVPSRLAEEDEARQVLSDLYARGVADSGFDVQLAELRDAVAAHAEAEEELEFMRLREVTDPAELTRMAAIVQAAQLLAPSASPPDVAADRSRSLQGPPDEVFDRVSELLAQSAGEDEVRS
ncbi:hemerythrin domain-containing protein [Catellatospora sichuanensis]|uniref:hemerythrin domain-containing protein n=1 Tax=Catellatospora sichuanensis TaxID=1969805 RepID=UPI001182A741|nr:hemerythrin domain-containing protein [Catellatospora sichuanensis]